MVYLTAIAPHEMGWVNQVWDKAGENVHNLARLVMGIHSSVHWINEVSYIPACVG